MTDIGLRLRRFELGILVIAIGFSLRRFGSGLGLSFDVVKYGGSLLWGTMVFMLVGCASGLRYRGAIALTAAMIALCIELFRLYHTPWLDTFRLSSAGALLLGRVFSMYNLMAYGAGILVGFVLDRLSEDRAPRLRQGKTTKDVHPS